MKIEHVAIWVKDLEGMREFYETFFNCKSNNKYHNREKKFESYFLTFESGARLEIMRKEGIVKTNTDDQIGWAHIAISLGSKDAVNQMSAKFENSGYPLINGPRMTGDGYYESVIKDPEGNLIELTV
ncbi:VOC family protein [Gottfriedia acidiceleris]|uniref:VOC family protein n=1 Tax=Bacillaceae TaxID=186817 RepID=UPI000BED44C3|nr:MULTISPECIES: VOC family protein [unclassified Bacillus (in: firmicutes)]PEC48619.1 glyoxalase/bleomycin resistance/extradiol dioxygenase family protein [Bacillus sp. AFS096315]PFM82613.1 glyoxalase/bleomycin resistance/extradiol dioxygenase family protein [Bacillus sp. AFS077874]